MPSHWSLLVVDAMHVRNPKEFGIFWGTFNVQYISHVRACGHGLGAYNKSQSNSGRIGMKSLPFDMALSCACLRCSASSTTVVPSIFNQHKLVDKMHTKVGKVHQGGCNLGEVAGSDRAIDAQTI